MAADANSSNNRETTMWSGKRTGIRVALEPEYDEFGIEDPARVFAAAQPPRRLDLGVNNDHTSTAGGGRDAVPHSPPGRMMGQDRGGTDPMEIDSVQTASPDSRAVASRDAPQQIQQNDVSSPDEDHSVDTSGVEKSNATAETNDFPEQDPEEPEDDLIPPPPPALDDDDDDDDDVTESGDDEAAAAAAKEEQAQVIAANDTNSDTEEEEEQAGVAEQPNEFVNNDDDDNEDDEDDGEGFAMAESVVTPTSSAGGKRKRKPGRQKMEKKVRIRTPQEEEDEANTEDEEDLAKKPLKKKKKRVTTKNRFAANITPKGRPGARTFQDIPLSALQLKEDSDGNLRRSSRPHIAPLEWWKGETYILGPNNFGEEYDGVTNMPIVKGIKKPNPTPYKKVVAFLETKKKPNQANQKKKRDLKEDEEMEYDQHKLERMYTVNEGETANLTNEDADEISRMSKLLTTCALWQWKYKSSHVSFPEILSRFRSQVHQKLPVPKGQRTKREGKKAGKATQCFNVVADSSGAPSFISGTLILPPKAIKDAESVLSNIQHFTVITCQPKALEVAYADPRDDNNVVTDESAEHFLLERADTFFVPAGNAYRLVNHSATTEAIISWMIIRNTTEEEDVYEEDE
jgi:hypothetical protein